MPCIYGYHYGFFKDGQPITRWAKITIELNENALVIPVAQISPSTDFETLFKGFHSFLLGNNPRLLINSKELVFLGNSLYFWGVINMIITAKCTFL